jgi:hypothetical protein
MKKILFLITLIALVGSGCVTAPKEQDMAPANMKVVEYKTPAADQNIYNATNLPNNIVHRGCVIFTDYESANERKGVILCSFVDKAKDVTCWILPYNGKSIACMPNRLGWDGPVLH